jgi:hypothetical protein
MKKILCLILLVLGLATVKAQGGGGDLKLIKTVIIQFKNAGFEKRIPEIVNNLKGSKGIVSLSHCDSHNLFVINFDVHLVGNDVEKTVISKVPTDLQFDFKEGTIKQITDEFGACLISEIL